MSQPFIITVASEKGGVGKTTIATNLAVYLKALREDLPVTIASFDNHFSVDQMFAIGGRTAGSLVDLLNGAAMDDVVIQGEYGVQFVASDRRLAAQIPCPADLGQLLRNLSLPGLLILDTRPILDDFTRSALLAADLILVPIKDRASLVNTAAIKSLLEQQGAEQRLWLVPSLVDARARLNPEVRVKDFLLFSAEERDYQVVDTLISKSPKVESLASGFSSRIHPVLTHARQTAVHGQLRKLADFVLEKVASGLTEIRHDTSFQVEVGRRLRRLVKECPVCCQQALDRSGHFFFDLRSRRCGFVHPHCFSVVIENLEGVLLAHSSCCMAIQLEGAGMLDAEPHMVFSLLDADYQVVVSEQLPTVESGLRTALELMTGCSAEEWQREMLLIEFQLRSLQDFRDERIREWRERRRRFLRAVKPL